MKEAKWVDKLTLTTLFLSTLYLTACGGSDNTTLSTEQSGNSNPTAEERENDTDSVEAPIEEPIANEETITYKTCTPPAAGMPWETATPEEVGLNAERLQEAATEAMLRQSGTFQVFRFDCLVTDQKIPVLGDLKRNMWSHTKTVVSLIVGRAVTLGHLAVTDTVGKYFPEADEEHSKITLEQLLTMSSGLNMNWVTELNLVEPDRVATALNLPFDHPPGTWFEYAQTTPTLITAVVERAVGVDFQDFAQQELFNKIGIERDSWFWLRDRAGNTEGYAWWFSLPNPNLARLGTLMLREGEWNGLQVIDKDYMRNLRTPSATNPGYGYLIWLNQGEDYITTGFNTRAHRQRRIIPSAPEDLYTSAGFHGQVSTVIPSLDMVVTRTQNYADLGGPARTLDFYIAGTDFGEGFYEIFRKLMLAVDDIDYEDPGPWDYPADYTLDLGQFINNPLVPLGSIGIGPLAPGNCTILGCDGSLGIDGTIDSVKDILLYGMF